LCECQFLWRVPWCGGMHRVDAALIVYGVCAVDERLGRAGMPA
jgi:hypothetical protein